MKETKAYYNKKAGIVVLELNGFITTERFIKAGIETHNLRLKYKVYKQMNNIKDMKVLTKDIQSWIDEVWFPKAKETGLKYFAFIVPTDVFGKLTMETANNEASQKYNMEIKYFIELKSAEEWLKSK